MLANTISAGIKEVWDDTYQIVHFKQSVFRAMAVTGLADKLKKGDKLHRIYTSDMVVNTMSATGGYSVQDLTDTDESLTVDQEKEVSFYIKELDELQNHLPVRLKYARKAMNKLWLQIDGDVLGEYDQADNDIDAAYLGGTNNNGITVDETNVDQLFVGGMEKLRVADVIVDVNARFTGDVQRDAANLMPVAIISPQVYSKLLLRVGGKDSAFGDKVAQQGHIGYYLGFNVFVSNALGWSGSLGMATLPVEAETVTINGVAFTFKDEIGTTAGNVHIASTVDITRANFASAINTPGTSVTEAVDAGFVALSTANQNLLKNVVATNDNTNDLMTLKVRGKSFIAVSETLGAAADVWTAALQIQHNLFCTNQATTVIVQKTPNLRIKDAPSAVVGYDFISWGAYGLKTFDDQDAQLVDAKVRTDAF